MIKIFLNTFILWVTLLAVSLSSHATVRYVNVGNIGIANYACSGELTKIDPEMNPWLETYTIYNGKQRLGIIPLDFYNNGGDNNPIENGLIINIVNSNF